MHNDRFTARIVVIAVLAISTAEVARATAVFVQLASMHEARVNHTATLLKDGTVLVVGGLNQDGLVQGGDLFDPQTGSWSSTEDLIVPRHLHTATLLADGRVLIVGGLGRANLLVPQAEIYDPKTRTFRPSATLQFPRYWHTAVRLGDGRVLVAGGYGVGQLIRPAEIYDPTTDTFTVAASLHYPRAGHIAFLLGDGDVLIAGGQGYDYHATPSVMVGTQAELFDVHRGVFVDTGSMALSRPTCAAVMLADGRIALFGGGDDRALRTTEIYDPATHVFELLQLGPQGLFGRRLESATPLPDGRVVLIGGLGSRNQYDRVLGNYETFDPATGLFQSGPPFLTTDVMKDPRQSHTATLLPDGRVLVVGGIDRNGALSSVEALVP